ncbi:hypothetical protein [Nonomuraea sediminis]|nr:hypothetical protein [Nonomuraea sediminis]
MADGQAGRRELEVLGEVRVLRSPSRGTKVPAARRLTVGGVTLE